MNIFRLVADLTHIFAITFLLSNICHTKSSANISAKSQILYLIVFLSRYLDLFTNFVSLYNTACKISFIVLTFITIYLVCIRYTKTYDRRRDTFWVSLLLVPAAALAFIFNHEFSVMEILWTFSIYLESVAVVPQLYMIRKLPFLGLCCFRNKDNESILEENNSEDFEGVVDGLGQHVPIEMLNEDIDDENDKIDNVRKAYLSNKIVLSSSMVCHYIFALGLYRFLYIFNWVYTYKVEGFYDVLAVVGGCIQTFFYVKFFAFYLMAICSGQQLKV